MIARGTRWALTLSLSLSLSTFFSQTTKKGEPSWPTSAEGRLQTFLANTNRSLRDLRRELVELAERIQDQD